MAAIRRLETERINGIGDDDDNDKGDTEGFVIRSASKFCASVSLLTDFSRVL